MRKTKMITCVAGIALFCVGMFLGGSAAAARPVNDYIIYMPVIAQHAGPVHVVETMLLWSKYGYYDVVGNLQNLGSEPVYDVVVQAVVYDDLGQWRQTYTSTTNLPVTFPGHFNWFRRPTPILARDNPNAHLDLQVISWSLESDIAYQPLTLVSYLVDPLDGNPNIDAEFRNDTPYELTDLHPRVWELTEYIGGFNPAPPTLAPGESFTTTGFLMYINSSRIPLIKIEGWGQYSAP